MEPNKLIKDKNKLLMAIPVILGILFLYVFFIREDGNVPSGSDRQTASLSGTTVGNGRQGERQDGSL
jgi:hypothetical protein